MIGLPPGVKIYLCTEPVDFRKEIKWVKPDWHLIGLSLTPHRAYRFLLASASTCISSVSA